MNQTAHLGVDILDRFLVGRRSDGGLRLLESLYVAAPGRGSREILSGWGKRRAYGR